MSIIQEALKRAQYSYASKRGLQRLPQEHEQSKQEPTIPANAQRLDMRLITKKIAIIIYVITLLALVTGFGIRTLFLKIVTVDKGRASKDLTAAQQKSSAEKTAPQGPVLGGVERASERSQGSSSTASANQVPDLLLNGIMYVEERPKAIINGTVVREGDVINGATVTSITDNNVLLRYNNNDNQVEVALKLKE